jgi:hydrogenase 3 maturation protease
MKKLAAVLSQKLKNADRIAVLGIGSDIRGDDAAGVIAAQRIKKSDPQKNISPQIEVFIGATAPENLTGEIKKFNPSHLVIIDSADTNSAAGNISVIKPEDVAGTSFCTHCLPLNVMIDYILQSCPDLKVIIIGIQPKTIDMNIALSREVEQAIEEFAKVFNNLLLAE